MKRNTVSSTTMRTVGYDHVQNILEIEFIDNDIYQYLDVPFEVYNGLVNGDSLGKYLNEVIKQNFEYKKID